MSVFQSVFVFVLQVCTQLTLEKYNFLFKIITALRLYQRRQKKGGAASTKVTHGKQFSQYRSGDTAIATAHMKVKLRRTVEIKMVANILYMALAMLMKSAFYAILLFGSNKDIAFVLFTFATDLFSLINPIFLLISSEHTRKMLADFVIRREKYTI